MPCTATGPQEWARSRENPQDHKPARGASFKVALHKQTSGEDGPIGEINKQFLPGGYLIDLGISTRSF